MPCHDPRDHETAQERRDGEHIAILHTRCDMLTNLLCKAGRAYEGKRPIPPEVLKWWVEHCQVDAARGEPW